jgi:pimeloyl-ACP methyl ester carboxylesterase
LAAREASLATVGDSVKFSDSPQVGLDLLQSGTGSDDLSGLFDHVENAIADCDAYFSQYPDAEFRLGHEVLRFSRPHAVNRAEIGCARLFESRSREAAVILLPHWNAERAAYRTFGKVLALSGITCLQLSMPFHDERQTEGVGYAREMVCENLGLTIRSNRQAIVEARNCLTWLQAEGYKRLAVIGISLGSSIGSIVAALDNRVKAAALLLMADDFAEVVWTGTATRHIQASLAQRFSLDHVVRAWGLISPATYAERLSSRGIPVLIISGALDRVFIPELTQKYIERLRRLNHDVTWVRHGCGHYTLSTLPYSAIAVANTIRFLQKHLLCP